MTTLYARPAGPVPAAGPTATVDHYGRALLQWLIAGGSPGELSAWQLEITEAAAARTVTSPVTYADGLYDTVSGIRHAIAGTLRAKRAIDAEQAGTGAPAPQPPQPGRQPGALVPAPAGPGPRFPPGGVAVTVVPPAPVIDF
jgi:hypothetical protein